MEKYQATFGISCGVSPGYGVKSSDYVTRTEPIEAASAAAALLGAMHLAREYAKDYLSNPEDNLTTVRLTSLRNSQGQEESQPELFKMVQVKDRRLTLEEESIIYHCSQLEHFMLVAAEQKKGI